MDCKIHVVKALAWTPIKCKGKLSARISCGVLFLLKFHAGDGPCRAFRSMCSIRTAAIIVILRTVQLKIDPENDTVILEIMVFLNVVYMAHSSIPPIGKLTCQSKLSGKIEQNRTV